MKRWSAIGLLLLVMALVLAGCAPAPRPEAEIAMVQDASPAMVRGEEVMLEKFAVAPAEAPLPAPPVMGVGGDLAERMIIRQTYMDVLVQDTDVMLARLQEIIQQYGGYVSDMNRWFVNEQPFASVVLRLPAEHLDSALAQVREGSIRVESERASGQDVTEEYVDLSARLRNLEATETELLELLTEVRRNRGSAEDILAIHNRITEIRAQIESLKGRTQFLERMTAMATVHIEIHPRVLPGAIVQPARWNPLVTISNAARTFVGMLQILMDVAIWLLVFSPLVLIPVLVLWLVIRGIRRRRAHA